LADLAKKNRYHIMQRLYRFFLYFLII